VKTQKGAGANGPDALLFNLPLLSVQALDVAGQRFDVLVAQLGGDATHDHGVAVVGAIAFAEVGQLLGGVRRVLPTQLGEASQVVAGVCSSANPTTAKGLKGIHRVAHGHRTGATLVIVARWASALRW